MRMLFNAILFIAFYVIVYAAAEFAYLRANSAMYSTHFREIQGEAPRYRVLPAAVTYLVMFFVVYHFVIGPIFRAGSRDAMPSIASVSKDATLLALGVYGVYNLTNRATLKHYTVRVAVQDTLWGVVSMNAVAACCYALKWASLRY